MADELQLLFLGGCRVLRGGAPVTGFVSAKAQALLCYLALTGRPHFRQSLAGLLWAELPEADARTNLRHVLSNLNKLLPGHLLLTRETATFNRDQPYLLDVERLQAQAGRSREPAYGLDAERLRDALELYTGDFLAGFYVRDAPAFDEWAAAQRERLRQLAADALSELAAHDAAHGDSRSAVELLERLLSLDPWREAAHRQLMLVLAQSGRRDAALMQFETCRRVLWAELGVEPEDETVALADRIRSGPLEPPAPGVAPRRAHLPLQPTPLLGRERELAQLSSVVGRPGCRLITMVGPGGIGKTRLAIEVASQMQAAFADGVVFVPLAPVRDSTMVGSAIAQALGVNQAGRPLIASMIDALGDTQTLLVLDNWEHVLGAAPLVTELLAAAPRLAVLATSRAPLRLRGERVFHVPPLDVPPLAGASRPADARSPDRPPAAELSALLAWSAIQLFVQRAEESSGSFVLDHANAGAVVEICRRLDGLPLAIELAAARVPLLPPQALLARLNSSLSLLTAGPRDLPERHQTLRNAISWSYDLLTPDLQRLLRRLAVFAGGCSLAAIEAVCGDEQAAEHDEGSRAADWTAIGAPTLDGVAALLEQSLLRHATGDGAAQGEPRFELLETIRQYAQEQLEAAREAAAVQRRHAGYYLALAETASEALAGPDKALWLERLEREHDNLRAALAWSAGDGDPGVGLRLGRALWRFWLIHGHVGEGRAWFERLLAQGGDTALDEAEARAGALLGAAWLAHAQDDFSRATALLEASSALLEPGRGLVDVLVNRAMEARAEGDYVRATALLQDGLARCRASGDRSGIGAGGLGLCLARLALVLCEQRDFERAEELWQECLALHRELGDRGGIAASLLGLSDIARDRGDARQVEALGAECLAIAHELGEQWAIGFALNNLAQAALMRQDVPRAATLVAESLAVLRAVGSGSGAAEALATVGYVALAQGRAKDARSALDESLALGQTAGPRWLVAASLEGLAALAVAEGQVEVAARLLGSAAARDVAPAPRPAYRQSLYERTVAAVGAQAQRRRNEPR